MEGTDFTKKVSKLKLNMAKKRLAKVKKRLTFESPRDSSVA